MHFGSPTRFSLSVDGSDAGFESCVLLDHVPHREVGMRHMPILGMPSTYTRSMVTLDIPDVACERCVLQLTSMMSDGLHGIPAGTSCVTRGPDTAPGSPAANASLVECPTYHSCAAVSISGSTPRSKFTCPQQPADWPYRNLPPAVYLAQADTAGDSGYDGQGWLLAAPERYREPAGPCAESALAARSRHGRMGARAAAEAPA